MSRLYSLDVVKLLFAYLIALGHFGVDIAPGGGIVVQFFFIISGVFLARKFYQKSHLDPKKEYNNWKYTKDHVKSLYPHYLFSLTLLALYYFVLGFSKFLRKPTMATLSAIFYDLYELVPELLLVQNSGVFNGGINYPLWQLCALVISGFFVYGLLCLSEKWSRELIFPAAILMVYSFLKTGPNLWGTSGAFHVPLLRAFAPLCIGVLFYNLVSSELYKRICSKKIFLNCASLLAFACLFLFKGHQYIYLIIFPVFLLSVFEESSWINLLLNRRIFRSFADLSYSVYLNHALLKVVLNSHIFPRLARWIGTPVSSGWKNVIFLICLTIYSVFTMLLVNAFKRWMSTRKKPALQA